MARFTTNVSAKSHQRVKLDGFRGIDTSSAPIEVEKFRATEMRNIISRNGLNRKRHGWEQQLLNINQTFSNNFGGAVQGIYGFKFADENDTRTIVYANCRLWHQSKKGEAFEDITPEGITLYDRPCQFYLIGDALYIIGMGAFLVYDGNEIKNVADYAYVPTNLINVISEEEKAKTTASIDSVVLEDINLLTSKFKVSLIGNDHEDKDGVFETFKLNRKIVQLEGEVYYKSDGDYVTKIESDNQLYEIEAGKSYRLFCLLVEKSNYIRINQFSTGEIRILGTGAVELFAYFKDENNGSLYLEAGNKTYLISNEIQKIDDINYFRISDDCTLQTIAYDGKKYLKLCTSNYNCYGTAQSGNFEYINIYGRIPTLKTNDGSITSYYNFNGEIFFTSSIKDYEIRLTCSGLKDYSARITDCAVSTLFGVDGHSDRLFVAGNKNTYGDWASNCVVQWSEVDNFTYFPDVNYTRLGTQATAINGMQRLNDDSLCLFKEASTTEPTIYVMYGEFATDMETNDVRNMFRTYAGNVAEGLIAPLSTGNLAGDILMLSPNGVYGIEMSENVVSTSKYTKERGLPIKRFIKEFSTEELKKACSIVRDDRYILCIGDKCFVAESRYSYKPKGSPRDTFSYEWYVWDNIPALCFREIDGDLFFGTADGRLCKFTNGFEDILIDDTTATLANGNLTIEANIKKGDYLIIRNSCYGKVATCSFSIIRNSTTGMAEGYKLTFDKGDFFFINNDGNQEPIFVEDSLIYINVKGVFYDLTITQINPANYIIYCKLDMRIPYVEDLISVYFKIDDKTLLKIENEDINLDEENNQPKLSLNGVPINSIETDTVPDKWKVCTSNHKNVVAEWYSNTIDFGVPDYSKTLLGFTVVPERIEGDSVQFGYITREVDNESDVKQLKKSLTTVVESPLDLEGLSLYLLSFNTFQTSFTKKVKVRNFNYLMWFFKSDSPTDTAINNIVFDYKINHKNKGVN